jgi:spore coat protein U-like protein
MRKTTLGLALLTAVLAFPAMATTAPLGNLSIKATVVTTCSLNTAAAAGGGNGLLDFGSVTSTINNVDADTTSGTNYGVSVICTNTTPYSVVANNGANASGTQNRMVGAAGVYLPYNLYTTTGRTVPFPTSGTTLGFVGNGLAQAIPVYGRIPAATALPAPNTYTDTVVLTITY